MIDWPARWARKTERLHAANMDWKRFRRDPVLMEGIQTLPGQFEKMYQRCIDLGVPVELMADDPSIGDPEGRFMLDTFMTAASMKHASQAHRISTNWTPAKEPIRVLEIGGGYGGLLAALLKRFKVEQYAAIDSEPMHRIRHEYLARLRNWYDDPLCLVDAYPGKVRYALFGGIDLAVASNALVEMPVAAVDQFFEALNGCIVPGGAFYTVNSARREITTYDFPWGDGWEFRLDGPAFGDERFSEILAVRK